MKWTTLLLCAILLACIIEPATGRRRRRNRRRVPPEPVVRVAAGACNLAVKPNCMAYSHQMCGVTNNYSGCRTVIMKYCQNPEKTTDEPAACKAKRCAGVAACGEQPGHGGVAQQCGEQQCKATPKPEPAEKSLCPMPSPGNCVAYSHRLCGVTSVFGACRTVVQKYCTTPVGHNDAIQCAAVRCPGGCAGQPGLGGVAQQCREQACPTTRMTRATTAKPTKKPEKKCVIKCRASSLRSCGISDQHKNCRRRYMIGCIDEVCFSKRRTVRTVSPEVVKRRRKMAERKKALEAEMPCPTMCKMQAYKKCGVTGTHEACRMVYAKDCNSVQCVEPECMSECRVMAFGACGADVALEQCRDDYRELCKPIRCRKAECMRESLLECGEIRCRAAYIAECLTRKNNKWKTHIEDAKKV